MTLIPKKLFLADLISLIGIQDAASYRQLETAAQAAQQRVFANRVYFRGLIEFSNICEKDCLYCGIRSSNKAVKRYRLSQNEIIETAVWCWKNGYGSIVLQSGENSSLEFVQFVEEALRAIQKACHGQLGITLCCGEQTESAYRRWLAAGAKRYLLRIETSNALLYKKIHPKNHSFAARVNCLKILKDLGWQTGTGVMIGLPEQTDEDLAKDILFFNEIGACMLGMGPYIPHNATPMGLTADSSLPVQKKRLQKSLNMIAATRLYMPQANIAATTALQALDPQGREKGIAAGANILMPLATPQKARAHYQLYNGKPCIEHTSAGCKGCLTQRMASIGRTVGYGKHGDSPLAEPIKPNRPAAF